MLCNRVYWLTRKRRTLPSPMNLISAFRFVTLKASGVFSTFQKCQLPAYPVRWDCSKSSGKCLQMTNEYFLDYIKQKSVIYFNSWVFSTSLLIAQVNILTTLFTQKSILTHNKWQMMSPTPDNVGVRKYFYLLTFVKFVFPLLEI